MHVGAHWLSCETPAASGPPGLHMTTRELQTRTFERPGASNTTKIPREDPQRGKKRMKFPVGEGKKRAKFWAPHPSRSTFSGFGPPPLRAPTPSGPHPFGAPPLRAPTPSGPQKLGIPPRKLAKCGLAKFGQLKLAKFGQIRMAKCGQLTLAKCGIGQIRFGQMRPNKDGQIRFGQIRPRPKFWAPHPSGPHPWGCRVKPRPNVHI